MFSQLSKHYGKAATAGFVALLAAKPAKAFVTPAQEVASTRLFHSAIPQSTTVMQPFQDTTPSEVSSDEIRTSLLSALRAKPEIDWVVGAPINDYIGVTAKAFAGSNGAAPEPMMDFALQGIIDDDESDESRRHFFHWILQGAFEAKAKESGVLYGHPKPEGDDGVASAVFLVPFDPSVEFEGGNPLKTLKKDVNEFVGMVKNGIPRPLRSLPKFAKFTTLFMDMKEKMDRAHAQFGPSGKHLYVNGVAADPELQGRGLGKQLMNQVAELGDSLGLPCYLECAGEKNPAIYRKYGFEVVGETDMGENRDGSRCILFHMVREAPQA